ncbi:hypothetical protein [Microcoleus sp. POL10_C6]|uniref:hypothetical protein n=1 Tax=Microcoleus sp. POL10_C6 TaxID=2818852 RepID=UPI002FD484D7
MKQETLDYIAASIGVITIASTYIFWLASRQIKDSLTHKIERFAYDLMKKQETDTLNVGYKMRRWQDVNKLRAITVDCRLEAIERQLQMPTCNVIQTIEQQFEDTDSTI